MGIVIILRFMYQMKIELDVKNISNTNIMNSDWGNNFMVRCPNCKSTNVVPIMYGMPSYEGFQASERREIILGGCIIYERQPDYGCLDCEHWWSKGSLPVEAIRKIRFKMWDNGPGFLENMRTWVYEIHPSGKVIKYTYYGNNRKYSEKEIQQASEQQTMCLYRSIQKLVENSWRDITICSVCDGSSYQLQVSYIDGRKEIFSGDVGGGTVDKLLTEFFTKVFWEDEE